MSDTAGEFLLLWHRHRINSNMPCAILLLCCEMDGNPPVRTSHYLNTLFANLYKAHFSLKQSVEFSSNLCDTSRHDYCEEQKSTYGYCMFEKLIYLMLVILQTASNFLSSKPLIVVQVCSQYRLSNCYILQHDRILGGVPCSRE